jgi:hypothetical protein
MEPNLGVRGATYQSWHGDAIRVIFREIQQANPKTDEKRLIKLLAARLSEDADAAKAAAEYIVKNMIGVQRKYAATQAPTTEQRIERDKKLAAIVQTGINKIILLNYPMPNGQRLRHCSGTYVAKLGGAWSRVGKKAGNKLIGEVFNEDTLRECMQVEID